MSAAPGWGPWAPDLEPPERLARWRALRAVATLCAGRDHSLVDLLRQAETDASAGARAAAALAAMPSRFARSIIAGYGELDRPPTRQRQTVAAS